MILLVNKAKKVILLAQEEIHWPQVNGQDFVLILTPGFVMNKV